MPRDANRIHTIPPESARDDEQVFRALLACDGRFDGRVIHDATLRAMDRLREAKRIRFAAASRLANMRVYFCEPRLHVRCVERRKASPPAGMRQTWDEWQVVQGRRVISRHDLRDAAEAERARLFTEAQR